MPKVRFSQEDFLEGNQLTPGWRTLKVRSVTEQAGKRDPSSTVWEVAFLVSDGSKDNGTPIRHWFTEKRMKNLAAFVRCFAPKAEKDKDYELDELVGREIMGYCKYDVEQKWNTIEDFRPIQMSASQ
jgi:hypothetical protein